MVEVITTDGKKLRVSDDKAHMLENMGFGKIATKKEKPKKEDRKVITETE